MTRLLRRLLHSSARRLTLIAMALGMCSLANGNKETRPQKPPYDVGYIAEPRLFAEGLVSTEDDESGGTFSPAFRAHLRHPFPPRPMDAAGSASILRQVS